MHNTTSKHYRPSLDIEFWSSRVHGSPEHGLYMKTNYIDTKKLLKSVLTLSEDGLVLTTENQWSTEKDFLEFVNDPFIVKNLIDPSSEYNEKHGIILKVIDTVNDTVSIQGPRPYRNLVIPDTWKNVEEFGNWWIQNGMPLMFPEDAEVFLSDDATAVCLFRKGRFQVELYLIHPNPIVPVHEHPGVEVIKVRLGAKTYPFLSETLKDGKSHGSGIRNESEEKGYPLLAIQHWIAREPTTVASMWRGNTVGPKQEALIKRFTPDAVVKDGWASTGEPL
jgi:hypothetical protein